MPKGTIPSIKVKPGMLPSDGRLTTPVGTFLPTPNAMFSNPSAATDGWLGGTQPSNIPQIGPSTSPQTSQASIGPQQPGFLDWLKGVFAPKAPQMYNEMGLPVEYEQHSIWDGKETITYNPIAYDQSGNRYTYDTTQGKYLRDETSAFSQSQSPRVNTSYYTNDLVGKSFESSPQTMSIETLRAVLPGYSFEQVSELMRAKGYEFQAATKGRRETAGMFVLTGTPGSSEQLKTTTGALIGPTDARGRPQWVDPTSLERGERVQVSSGTTYVGGADYTNPAGETVSQYAVTVAQNINKKLEEKGAYKWVSKTVQDAEGNWVKVYSKQLRAPYTKRGRKQRDLADDGNGSQQPAAQDSTGVNMNQLVTLRVNYG